jgi:hypothetical protein
VKKFILITLIAAGAFIVSVILHNLISGLFHVEEPVFFILAVIVAPLAFLVGLTGLAVYGIRRARRAQ